MADQKYVPFFHGLVENLLAVHSGKLEIHLLAIGDGVKEEVRNRYPDVDIRIYDAADVWSPEEQAQLATRPIGIQAMTAKPRILLKALEQNGHGPVYLTDLDVFYYRSPHRLAEAFDDANVLLFPQWSDRFTWSRLHGSINGGLVGARRGAEAMLSWWSGLCFDRCDFDLANGYFGDQVYLELAPIYFRNVQVYRGFDENVAPWNRRTLGVTTCNGRPWPLKIHGGKYVGSFHAAGPDDSGIFELKFCWDQLVAFFTVDEPDAIAPLFENVLDQQREHWVELNRLLKTQLF